MAECCQTQRCGPRAIMKTIRLAVNATMSGYGSSAAAATAHFRVQVPSVLIHCTIAVFSRDNAGSAARVNTDETWQITPQAQQNGDQPLSPIFVDSAGVAAGRSLPDSYEFETGIKAARVDVTLRKNNNAAGTTYAQAIFEPAAPGLSQDELEELFAACDLALEGAILSISG